MTYGTEEHGTIFNGQASHPSPEALLNSPDMRAQSKAGLVAAWKADTQLSPWTDCRFHDVPVRESDSQISDWPASPAPNGEEDERAY